MATERYFETILASRRKIMVLLLISLAFTAVAIVLIRTGHGAGYIGLIFAPVVPIALVRFIRPPAVHIGSHTVMVRQMFGRSRTYELKSCTEFSVWSFDRRARGVAFDYDYPATIPRWAGFTRRRYGVSEHISDLYTLPPGKLAEALNHARDRAAEAVQ